MEDVKVKITMKCPKCNGTGENEECGGLWHLYNKADRIHKEETGEFMSDKEYREWWKSQGYSDIKQLPPEDYTCCECEGIGILEKTISIKVLKMLLDNVEIQG